MWTRVVAMDRVSHGATQIPPEFPLFFPVPEVREGPGEADQDDLANVLGVGELEPSTAAESENEVAVPAIELEPRLVVIPVPEAPEEGSLRRLPFHATTVTKRLGMREGPSRRPRPRVRRPGETPTASDR